MQSFEKGISPQNVPFAKLNVMDKATNEVSLVLVKGKEDVIESLSHVQMGQVLSLVIKKENGFNFLESYSNAQGNQSVQSENQLQTEQREPVHPAEKLNVRQLRTIGWAEYKRKNRTAFKKNREIILRDWKSYEYEELVKHFAMFIVVAHIENQDERQNNLLQYVMQSCSATQIHLLFNRLLAEYVKDEIDRAEWAKEGIEIGRAAWKVAFYTYDFEMEKVVLNVAFLYHMLKIDKIQRLNIEAQKMNSVENDKMSLAN